MRSIQRRRNWPLRSRPVHVGVREGVQKRLLGLLVQVMSTAPVALRLAD